MSKVIRCIYSYGLAGQTIQSSIPIVVCDWQCSYSWPPTLPHWTTRRVLITVVSHINSCIHFPQTAWHPFPISDWVVQETPTVQVTDVQVRKDLDYRNIVCTSQRIKGKDRIFSSLGIMKRKDGILVANTNNRTEHVYLYSSCACSPWEQDLLWCLLCSFNDLCLWYFLYYFMCMFLHSCVIVLCFTLCTVHWTWWEIRT